MFKLSSWVAVLVIAMTGAALAQDAKTATPDTSGPLPSIVRRKQGPPAAPPTAIKTSNARLEVPEKDFRFGYAPQNAKITHSYWLKNAGPDSLHLTDVRPGCGCTKAPLKTHVLGPGDSTDVEVIFSTGLYSNQTRKSANVVSDVPHMVPPLTFSAYPQKNVDSLTPFIVTPHLVDLDSLKDQAQSGSVEVRVRNTGNEPLSFKLVSAPSEWFTVDVPAGSVAPGSDEALQVRFVKNLTEELLNKSFTIEASDSAMTRYTVPVQKTQRWGPTTTSSAQ